MDDRFQANDRVILVHSAYLNLHGILRYKGPIEGTPPGNWFGVELDEPKGKNSGEYKGVFYFNCSPNHGVFVRVSNLRLESEGELLDSSPSKLPETETKKEKAPDEPLIKMEKTQVTAGTDKPKPVVEEKPKKLLVPTEKTSKIPEKKLKEPATTASTKDPAASTKDPAASKLIKKGLTTTTAGNKEKETKDVKKPVEKKQTVSLAEKKAGATLIKKPATTATTIAKKPTGIAAKVKKIQEEETKSIDSKDEVGEEQVEEEVMETKPDENEENPIELTHEKTQISTQIENEEASGEEVKALKSEIEEKNQEISQKAQEIKELQDTIAELEKKVEGLEKEKDKAANMADFENLNNLKLMQMEQKLKESERKSKHLENDYARLKKEFELQKDHLLQHENFTHMVEGLTIENETLKANIEALTMELEENKNEIKKLKEENEMIQLEMETAMEMPKFSEEEEGEALDKIKENNGKLRLALQILNEKYENEQIFHLEQIERYKMALEKIPELQQRIKEFDETKKILELKEQEIEELKTRLDEGSEYQEMIEMLTNDLMKKEEDIIDLKRTIKELKEERDVNNQLIEATEEENKELNLLIDSKDQEILALCKKIKEKEDNIEESDKYMNKFREKVSQMTKEIEMYKDNLQKTGGEESRNVRRIEELLQKQGDILAEKREIYKRMLNSTIINYKLSNEILTAQTFLKTLPPIFLEKLHLEAFNKFILIRCLRGKTLLLLEELQNNFITEQHAKENIELVNWVSKGLIYMNMVIYSLDILEISMMFQISEEEYLQFSKQSLFGTCTAIQVIIDSMLRTHREEAMSVKVPIEPLKILALKLMEQAQEMMKKCLEQEEKINENNGNEQIKEYLEIARSLYRNKYEIMRVRVYTENIWYICINRNYDQEKFEKFVLKINDCIVKINKKVALFLQIKNRQEFLISISRNSVPRVLNEKMFFLAEELELQENIQLLADYYEKMIDDFIEDKDNFHLVCKDIFDKMDNLFAKLQISVPNLKRFSLSIDGNLIPDPSQNELDTSEDEFHGTNFRIFGPWDICSQKLGDELRGSLENVENFEKMNGELKDQVKKALKLEEDLKAIYLVKESLEIRVADLQNKAERVGVLEMEKQRFLEREKHFNEAAETIRRELENAEKRNQELEEEINEIKSNVASLPTDSHAPEQQRGFNRQSVFTKSQSRETLMPYSRLSVANSNEKMLGGEVMRGASNTLGGGMSGVMLNLNADSNISDDSFDIIQRLLAENCYLKSREIRDKLQKLKKEMPKFSKYHQEIKTLNHADKNLENLSGLASEMRNIHKKAKSKMVEAKIVDLETLKDLTIAEKNENMNKFLKDARKSMELIKSEAISVKFKACENYKADIDEHVFQTHLDSGLQEVMKSMNTFQKMAEIELIQTEKADQKSNKQIQKIYLNPDEYLQLARKVLTV